MKYTERNSLEFANFIAHVCKQNFKLSDDEDSRSPWSISINLFTVSVQNVLVSAKKSSMTVPGAGRFWNSSIEVSDPAKLMHAVTVYC